MNGRLLLLRARWRQQRVANRRGRLRGDTIRRHVEVPAGSVRLAAPSDPSGWVIWPQSAPGECGDWLAGQLNGVGLATLQVAPASPAEAELEATVERVLAARRWLHAQPEYDHPLPLGLLGVRGEAPAVLQAASELGERVVSVVAADGYYESLTRERLAGLTAPTRLLASCRDAAALIQAQQVQALLPCRSEVVQVPGAGDPLATLAGRQALASLAGAWLLQAALAEASGSNRDKAARQMVLFRRLAAATLLISLSPLATARWLGTSTEARELSLDQDADHGAPGRALWRVAAGESVLELSSLDGSRGLVLNGVDGAHDGDRSGWAVARAGDVNFDGHDDVIIGAWQADPNGTNSGESYVVYGGTSIGSVIELSSLDGTNGFVINGVDAGDLAGQSVNGAGDVNGDGIDDVIIGANRGDPHGVDSGESYVLYGSSSFQGAVFELSSLNGSNGFTLNGVAGGDRSGFFVSAAGDVNADGHDDVIIGAWGADPHGSNSGDSYVVYGSSSLGSVIDLSGLDGADGFTLHGIDVDDASGLAVGGAGDVDGDGYDDVIIGAYLADPNGKGEAGEGYVVYGGSSLGSVIELSSLDGTSGFTLNGVDAGDNSSYAVSGAADVNGDGYDDVIIGAFAADPHGADSGESYVVYGGSSLGSVIELSGLSAASGITLFGKAAGDNAGNSVRGAGDVNDDTYDDVIVSAILADPHGGNSGESYVVYGGSSLPGTLELSSLGGVTGFTLRGVAAVDYSGTQVGGAGDLDNDGYPDLIIGAFGAALQGGPQAGESYVVYGGTGLGSVIELSALAGSNGFTVHGIDGIETWDHSGRSVSGAGDVNKDGFDDVIISADRADPNGKSDAGESYVVYGSSTLGSTVELGGLDGATGFKLNGVDPNDRSSLPVSDAGDVNNDGADDVIIGAWGADPHGSYSGESYIVYGGTSLGSMIELSGPDGTDGLTLRGIDAYDLSGRAVSSAGDVNGDGFGDVIIGAWAADPHGTNSGECYVVYGGSSLGSMIELSALDGTNGFLLRGVSAYDYTGIAISSAGDVNDDGIDDLIIGAPTADPHGTNSGETYVVYGGTSLGSVIELSGLNGTNGFTLHGINTYDVSALAVDGAGDVNGDGIDDVIIGAYSADPHGINSGESYVVYGGTSLGSLIELSGLDGSNGFTLNGIDSFDYSGRSVSRAGDSDGDGFADLIIGAWSGDPHGGNSGESYVVYGGSNLGSVIELSGLDGTTGFVLNGIDAGDQMGYSVSGAGDVDGDGYDDVVMGAAYGDANGTDSGESYVVYGEPPVPPTPTPTNTPSITPTPTDTSTPTPTGTFTLTPTGTFTPTPTGTFTPTPTGTFTPTPTDTSTPTPTDTSTPTPTDTSTPTPTWTFTPTPTDTSTPTPTITSTATPTPTPTKEPGDCNGDDLVNAGDITALILEVFDGDGTDPAACPGGTFAGNPNGCDPNADSSINAGDLTCTILLIFNQSCG